MGERLHRVPQGFEQNDRTAGSPHHKEHIVGRLGNPPHLRAQTLGIWGSNPPPKLSIP